MDLSGVPDALHRFEERYCPEALSGCWLWHGAINSGGYGSFSVGGKDLQAHRVSAALFIRPVLCGESVLHRCDNRGCVNPDHLEIGTHSKNMSDMFCRGRHAPIPPSDAEARARGERHGRAKLTDDDVREMRRMRSAGAVWREIGQRFGVAIQVARNAVIGKTWAHVKE